MTKLAALTASPWRHRWHLVLFGLLAVLWLAGGASRPEVLGQPVVRFAAVVVIAALIVTGRRPGTSAPPVALLLCAMALLMLLQLVPLPIALWRHLPARAVFDPANADVGYRPLSIAPDLTLNALMALVVPAAVYGVVSRALMLTEIRESLFIPFFILSALWALVQFAGVSLPDPFVNYGPGDVSGNFANRNHFALFVAIGLMFLPAWALNRQRRLRFAFPLTTGLGALFILVILASGSRSGIAFVAVAFALSLVALWPVITPLVRGYPRGLLPAVLFGVGLAMAGLVWLSIRADRAVAVSRALDQSFGDDLRIRAIPTIMHMLAINFPIGIGFGAFDPAYRINEPDALLNPFYLNRAHNDVLEVIVEGGLPAAIILIAVIAWWGWASVQLFRARTNPAVVRGRLGSATLVLMGVSSLIDYPLRTPWMMALAVVAATWLSWGVKERFATPQGRSTHRRASGGRALAEAAPSLAASRLQQLG